MLKPCGLGKRSPNGGRMVRVEPADIDCCGVQLRVFGHLQFSIDCVCSSMRFGIDQYLSRHWRLYGRVTPLRHVVIKGHAQHGLGGVTLGDHPHVLDEVGGQHSQLTRMLDNGRPLAETEV